MRSKGKLLSFVTGVTLLLISLLGPFVAHASPLTIGSCNDLEKIASSSYPTYTTSASYVLTQSFDCTITQTQNPDGLGGYYGFTPIPDFTGTFNGEGYTISNLYISTTTSNVGLFSILDGTSTVQNLTLTGGSISGGLHVGALAGEMIATSTVQNATSSVPVTGQGYIGGLVGYMNNASTSITSSSASGAVSSTQNNTSYEGGLVGYVRGGAISGSFATGPVTATGSSDDYIGGLAGVTANNSPVSNSYATGNVVASGGSTENVGGLLGTSESAVTNTYETGSVTANGASDEYIGGLIGANISGNIASSSAAGAVTATGTSDEYLSGFLGDSFGTISNSFETGSVTASSSSEYIAGFDGYQASGGVITECYETGNVTGAGIYTIGGLVGASYANINKSFETGNIMLNTTSYAEYDGGFVGFSEAALNDDYATGNVTIPAGLLANEVYYVGGFDGYSGAAISNSYATGNIVGTGVYDDIGGFVGYNQDPISNSYSTGGGTGLTGTSTATVGYFLGETSVDTLTNDAVFVQGTPAIGEDDPHSSSDALLATRSYGTDESTLSHFYSTTESVYDQGQGGAWDFSTVWTTHANTFPTFQWYSGVTPTYTITATAGTGGTITNPGVSSLLSGTSQTYTISPNAGYSIASVLVDGASVGAVSTYTFSDITANHTISVTFNAPVTSSGGGTGGGTVQNRVMNLIINGNTPAAIAVENQYPNLFPNGIAGLSGSTTPGSLSSTIASGAFTRSLTLGSTGADVKALQEYLNTHGFPVATSGAGSLGNETTYFGKATRAALAKFQKANGISPSVGYFGPLTRAYVVSHP